ncbi:MAG: glycosyltransferase family 4 protein [Thermoleophilia bacterium]|nr:glycosyltransferase family 4 protein [Thermoleophilia bacterium]
MTSDLLASPAGEGTAAEHASRPRVLLVGRTRYQLPLNPSLRPKFDALRRALDLRVLASAAAPPASAKPESFELVAPLTPGVIDGVAFYAGLPFRIARELRRFGPDAIIAQSPYEAAAALLARGALGRSTPVIVEVHGDWRTATRMYGSRLRLVLAPAADLVSRIAVRRADAVRTVSPYTTTLVGAYGVSPADSFPAYMDLFPFLERPPVPLPDRPSVLFVGVLEANKDIDGLVAAWRLVAARLPHAQLHVVGSGARADAVQRLVADLPGQTRWSPSLPSAEVAAALDDATALVLPSRSEGLGRVVIEALCRSRPVVGSRVGGIADLIDDGVNGLLVAPGDVDALAASIERVLEDRPLAERLSASARSSVDPWLLTPQDYAERTKELVGRVGHSEDGRKPRALLVGRTRYHLPLNPSLRPKFDALMSSLDLKVLASAARTPQAGEQDTFLLVPPLRPKLLDGVLFYALLPFRVARYLREHDPDAVITQSAYEAAAVLAARPLARRRTPVVLEVHGDWRTATRLYGSRLRTLLSPLADAVSRYAVRHADAVRTVSPYTTALVKEQGVTPADSFPAYMDLFPFLERPPAPLPERPVALFIGVLEAYKNIDGLADAWRIAAPQLPDARLVLVGSGSRVDVVEKLLEDLPEQTTWHPRLNAPEVARALDDATVLLLPSRSEGLGRVIIEALCRGRPVIGSRVGGIADLLEDGVNGVLVEPGDTRALADALVRVLSNRTVVERLAQAARTSVDPWLLTPDDYADRTRELVERVASKTEA